MKSASISKTGTETLDRIKKNINASYLYFKPNYDRFHRFRRFVFETSLDEQERNVLAGLNKPIIEFNILEAYISRLLGEFAKHEPSIEITPADGVPVDIETIKLVEGHIRHIIYEANKNSCSYEVYKDLLSGGFSTVKVWTDYASPMSFNQIIKLGRVFDPTLCGFDPMARFSHKADGRYCYEIFPQARADFEMENPSVDTERLTYSRNIAGFNWSYMNGDEEIVIRAEYFEKKKRKAKIVKLANGRVMTDKNYQKFEEYWKNEGFIAQIPAVIGKPRNTELETICRYRLIESEILDYKETDYTYLPLVFVDGNSIILRDGDGTNNSTQQMTRPYVYHAEGIQKLKNFAGQTLGNELENMIQHKIMIAKEALPQEEEYLQSYDNVQQASSYVYQAYSENNPDKPLPQPREIVRTPIPQEVMATYSVTDSTTQVILGSFDAAIGMNDKNLSGVAMQTGATLSNAAAMPYVTGYLQAWTHVACICTDLLPLYVVTPRTIPVIGLDGKREYKRVNEKKTGPQFDYDQGALQVYIEAGVNFQIQKNQALMQIIMLMQASPSFAEFMNGPGLPVLVANLTIYQADVLKEMVPEWESKKEEMQQKQMEQQKEMMASDPRMLTAKAKMMDTQQKAQLDSAKLQSEDKQQQFDNQIRIAELTLEKQEADAKIELDKGKLRQDAIESEVQVRKAQVEEKVHMVEATASLAEHQHRTQLERDKFEHEKNIDHHDSIRQSVKLKHEIDQANKPEPIENKEE